MRETDRAFAGSIPAFYDRYMVPLIFEPYARDLAARLAASAPGRVLETAAGTGIATRALAEALPVTTGIVATDLNQPMLDFAATRLAAPNVAWRQADALRLPFESGGFDAVICQFGAMFFPDKVAGYREARRMLRPGGRFVFSVWDRIERSELALVVSDAVAAAFPADPPRFLARLPHGYHDTGTIRAEVQAAGFAAVSIDAVGLRSRAPSPRHAALAFCQGTPLRAEIEARDADRLGEVTDAAERAVAGRFGKGAIDAPMRAYVITATG